MQRFRVQSTRLMGDAKEQGDIEFGGEVLLESKACPRPVQPLRRGLSAKALLGTKF